MSDTSGPISINFTLPSTHLSISSANVNHHDKSSNLRSKTPRTLTLSPNDREITNYLSISNGTSRVRQSKLILNEDHEQASSVKEAEDEIPEIKFRAKKDHNQQRVRPVSEASLGQKIDIQQLLLQKHAQSQDIAQTQNIATSRSGISSRHESLLVKELTQLNIKKDKIDKSLAATGYTNSMNAINWLMRHSKDPYLAQDPKTPTREYVLVLCPVGKLADQISKFMQVTKSKSSPDTIFNDNLPYMKLTSFFKISDLDALSLHKSFDLLFKLQNANSESKKQSLLLDFNIDLHVSSQMVLLYPDIESESSIKHLIIQFNKLASKMISLENEIYPYQKQLHLTLAYNFGQENRKTLEDCAKKYIDFSTPAEWDLRLYSRDIRAETKFTYRVIQTYKSKAYGELSLKESEYLYASAITTKDNFIKAVAVSTGESGFFPNKFVERANETDTWVLHKSNVCIGKSSTLNETRIIETNKANNGSRAKSNLFDKLLFNNNEIKQAPQQPPPSSPRAIPIMTLSASDNQFMQMRFNSNQERSLQVPNLLRFFISRHGERIDLTFGAAWLEQAFDKAGKYRRTNLNMPANLPIRNSKRDFIGDSPLTEVGRFQARLTGEALGEESYRIHYCYTSPALRCIQTAQQILQAQGLDKVVKLRIEPSVFEFLGWYERGLPKFLSSEALVEFGFNIDTTYQPLLAVEQLQVDENYTDYYQRSFNITKYFTNVHQGEGANILVVGHAGTLEVCTRQMLGRAVRSYSEFNQTIRKVPYLGLCMLKKEANSTMFEIEDTVIAPLGHTANFNFDSTVLTSTKPPVINAASLKMK